MNRQSIYEYVHDATLYIPVFMYLWKQHLRTLTPKVRTGLRRAGVRTSLMRRERFECTKCIIDLRVRLYTAPAPGRVVARVHPVGVTLHRVLALTRRHAPDAHHLIVARGHDLPTLRAELCRRHAVNEPLEVVVPHLLAVLSLCRHLAPTSV